ncbi:vacuolar protein-sorting-associated protein 33 homolog [Asparagus officinalis]|uniref:vacuolar protein-sorting-associated protein 33 homolog n=1 Tax=Asparagus officinalis TaxID=4686 RepID=UPI00098E5C5E|nr:vacuolar protein-sorting-associated protein 33 homolog [Asparagus officinalis]XP_020261403.1 vacuolar protein-sorting-associated protein 33 homolog [Asparagus officinalis]
MAQIPNLDNSPLNLASLREQSQKDLLNILKNVRGKKCLVIDPKLAGSLSLLIQTSLLKESGAELRYLSEEPVQTESSKVVYLVPSQPNLMKFISSNIQNDLSKGLNKEYSVYFVPRSTVACEKILEEASVRNLITLGDYPLYTLPLDEDVLSFELDLAFKECHVDGDLSPLWHIAKAIHKLELSFGVIPSVRAKGKSSTKVAGILNRMQVEESVIPSDVGISEINTLILIDREVDMVTPMCFQLTYEGLLDEILQINNSSVEVDASVMGSQQDGKKDVKKVKVPLSSSDKLFKEIRDLNFEVVVQVLRQKATSIQQDYAEVKSTTQISELKDFVKKLNSLPEIARHVNLAQHLQTFTSKPSFHARLDIEQTMLELQNFEICLEYIEEMIHKQEPIVTVLRLLVLFSITNSGLPKKHFDSLRRELLHSYGFEHMSTLYNLEKSGLLRRQESKSNWPIVSKALQLIADETDTPNPNDISYIFSGYAPLSIRLVQHAIRSGWRSIEDILKLLPGPHLDLKRAGSASSSFDAVQGAQSTLDRVADGRRAVALVVFIGGVTYAEVAALRFLSSQEGMGYDFIVGTTKMVNGNSILETLIPNSR